MTRGKYNITSEIYNNPDYLMKLASKYPNTPAVCIYLDSLSKYLIHLRFKEKTRII